MYNGMCAKMEKWKNLKNGEKLIKRNIQNEWSRKRSSDGTHKIDRLILNRF